MKFLKKILPLIIAGAGAGVWILLNLPLGYIGAAIVFFALWIVVAAIMHPKANPAGELLADGTSKLDFDLTMREARSKLQLLQNEAFKINKVMYRKKVDAISDVIARILDDIKKDPKDFRAARQFFSYYLDSTVKIIKYYVELSSKATTDPGIAESLARVEAELDTIRDAYEKLLKQLMENDKMDLDVELAVLKKTIEMEGLGADIVVPLPPTQSPAAVEHPAPGGQAVAAESGAASNPSESAKSGSST